MTNVTISEIRVLIALHNIAPATVTAINHFVNRKDGGNQALEDLVARGLVRRYKWTPPEVEVTEAMRLGFEPMPFVKKGKRPYLYELTIDSEISAAFFHAAFENLKRKTKPGPIRLALNALEEIQQREAT